jgi:hypothetical protein
VFGLAAKQNNNSINFRTPHPGKKKETLNSFVGVFAISTNPSINIQRPFKGFVKVFYESVVYFANAQ